MITLSGDAKSTQQIYRAQCHGTFPRTYMTREGKALKDAYVLEAKTQHHEKPTDKPLSLTLDFYFSDKRKRDLDNQNKLILDALTGLLYEDDSQIDELTLRRHYDKEKPRIEVSYKTILSAL